MFAKRPTGRIKRELLEDKEELDVEGNDRLYLNAYQPRLQTGGGVVSFFREHRGAQVASTTLMAPISQDFVKQIHRFAQQHELELGHFTKGQRKDEVTAARLNLETAVDRSILTIT